MLVLQVFIMRNGAFEGTEMVSGERVEVGSDPACGVVLDDPDCALRHAVIYEYEGQLAIQDLASKTGTKVNGERISGVRFVGPRDDVAVGPFTIKLKVMSGLSKAPSRAQPAAQPPTAVRPKAKAPSPKTDVVERMALTTREVPPLSEDDNDPTIAADMPDRAFAKGAAPATLALALDPPARTDDAILSFAPAFLDEELVEDDDERGWSLVEQLAAVSDTGTGKALVLEVIHSHGETVVDHCVLRPGQSFVLGANMTKAERKERRFDKRIKLVRFKGNGAEILPHPGQDAASTLAPGESRTITVGTEKVFVRFGRGPELLWTAADAAEQRFYTRLHIIVAVIALLAFSVVSVIAWIAQYRNADESIITLEDEGFAEVEIKPPEMEEPKKPDPIPEPVISDEPVPQKDTKPTPVAKPEKTDVPAVAPPKPGVMDILKNIPQVNDTASSQNLSAALSNVKGVRVPGAAAGVKVSALVGKGPSSGVQIGGAAGGLNTSGINSLLRKDGEAGALGGKGDRAVSGKVTTLPRQITKTGQGELSKEEIQKVISQHIGEIQYCYEKQLRKEPGLAGRVVLEWGINAQGKVTVVKVNQSQLQSSEATTCMMTKLKTWAFPPPRGGAVTIVFPFVFNAV